MSDSYVNKGHTSGKFDAFPEKLIAAQLLGRFHSGIYNFKSMILNIFVGHMFSVICG